MLIPEEIKQIAKTFAQETSCEHISGDNIALAEILAWRFAMWLLKDYCIVSKEEIKADYDSNALAAGQFSKGAGSKCAQMREWHQGKCDELISLFGKELFNEKNHENKVSS